MKPQTTHAKRYWCQLCGTWVQETDLKWWPAGGTYDGRWLLLCPGCDSELDRREDAGNAEVNR